MKHKFYLTFLFKKLCMHFIFYSTALLFNKASFAEIMKMEDKTVNRILPDEPGFKNDTEYKKKFEEMKVQLEQLQKTSQEAQNTLKVANKNDEIPTLGLPQETGLIGQKNVISSNETSEPLSIVQTQKWSRKKIKPSADSNPDDSIKRKTSESFYFDNSFTQASAVQVLGSWALWSENCRYRLADIICYINFLPNDFILTL